MITMSGILDRLKYLRKNMLKLTQSQFAGCLGITQTAYSMIETGKNPLTDKWIMVICFQFGVNEMWLRTGEGDPFVTSPYEKEFSSIYPNLSPVTQQYLLAFARELLKKELLLHGLDPEELNKPQDQ
ncbi:transcriptional regulator with XRE-family HTH domain [Cuneatibacter caecimuris]|uniref:Transcriptional regulator with XRE-family HTH domain n=2 Tax=Cuneatibacter caecimuris TaxID=1796618 RepID=A0A4Q7PKE1_9FIRM|nr:transcriptional regulator with XRE-family HTH domain [Cuneatibacter caecimuris]